jgi:O-acetyl-ADP-ribose deacetylase (regulator of RNase III)
LLGVSDINMKLVLVDQEPGLVECWNREFAAFPEVAVVCGDILSLAQNAIVSPANSYGFMDGGIDLLYLEYFGLQIQDRVQDAISRRQEGYLPVGASVVVKTGHPKIQYLVVSPTMILPEAVPAANCFFSMAATLSIASHTVEITDLYCPGLGTGVGRVPFDIAAEEMANAYRKWKVRNDASTPK